MKIINTKKWTIPAGETVRKLRFNNNLQGDTVTSEVYVQIPSGVVLTAKGYVDTKSDAIAMKLLNIGKYASVQAAEEAGIYMLMSGSLEEAELSFNNSGAETEVVVKELY